MPMGLGLGLGLGRGGASGYTFVNAEAEAVVAAFSVEPDDTRKALIDTLIGALKAGSAWSTFDAYYMMAAEDAQSAGVNWKNPGTYDLTPIDNPTFTADQGYAGNGTSSYLKTGFVPSTASGQWALNSAHMALWSRDSGGLAGTKAEMGARVASNDNHSILQIRTTSDGGLFRANQDATTGVAPTTITDGSGLFVGRRSASNALALFRNGSSIATNGTTSAQITDREIYIGAMNENNTAVAFSERQLAIASFGSSQADAVISARYTAELAYLQAIA